MAICLQCSNSNSKPEKYVSEQPFTEVEMASVVVDIYRAANTHHWLPTLRCIVVLVYTETARYYSTKMTILNSFIPVNDNNFRAQMLGRE